MISSNSLNMSLFSFGLLIWSKSVTRAEFDLAFIDYEATRNAVHNYYFFFSFFKTTIHD